MSKIEKIHIFISGRVQGVGFRYATQAEARKLSLTGWVRNTDDHRVEIHAEGEAVPLDTFLGWCYIGPAKAKVEEVHIAERAPLDETPFPDFEILP